MFSPWYETDYHPHDCTCSYHTELRRKDEEFRKSMTLEGYGKGISITFQKDTKMLKLLKAMCKSFRR